MAAPYVCHLSIKLITFSTPPPPPAPYRGGIRHRHPTELKAVTGGFAVGNFVGKGGSRSVYRGIADGKSVAVKRLDSSPADPYREFRNETQVLGGVVRSPFVVSLLGYAAEQQRLFLVYEYKPHRSLQDALFAGDGECSPVLWWAHHFEIVLDVARGLTFLHSECEPAIVHGDIKPSNVLLGNDYRACHRLLQPRAMEKPGTFRPPRRRSNFIQSCHF